MGIRFNQGCCCGYDYPAWTVYHNNVSKKQHLYELICNYTVTTGLYCDSQNTNLSNAKLYGTYSGDSGSSRIYSFCPNTTVPGLGGYAPTGYIQITPLANSLTGVYSGNNWVKAARIDKIVIDNIEFTYNSSKSGYTESNHYCGHSEFSGALSSNSYFPITVTPYVGYRIATNSGNYLLVNNISGSSVNNGYAYISGSLSGQIRPVDGLDRFSFSEITDIYTDFYGSLSDTIVNGSSPSSSSCVATVNTITTDSYNISFVSRLLPLDIIDLSGCVTLCSDRNLYPPINSKLGTINNVSVGISANKYHGICTGYQGTGITYIPVSGQPCVTGGSLVSGFTQIPYPYMDIGSGIFNYFYPPTNGVSYGSIVSYDHFSGDLGKYTESCNNLINGFSVYFPISGFKAPIINQYPVLSYLCINNTKQTSTATTSPYGPCDLYLPDIVCLDNITYDNTYNFTHKMLIASNSGTRHICDDFNISEYTEYFAISGDHSQSCSVEDLQLCANEEDFVVVTTTFNNRYYYSKDASDISFVDTIVGGIEGCAT